MPWLEQQQSTNKAASMLHHVISKRDNAYDHISAVAVGIDVPFQNIRKLPDDTGERFFSEYLHQQKERNLYNLWNPRNDRCPCGMCEKNLKPLVDWNVGERLIGNPYNNTYRRIMPQHAVVNANGTMIAVAGSNLTTALQTTDNDGGTESNETSLEELSRSVARAKTTA